MLVLCFVAGLVTSLLGFAVLWFFVRRHVAEWRKRDSHLVTDLEMVRRHEGESFARFLTAALRPLELLLGRGRAVYRAAIQARSWADLCPRIEGAMRGRYPGNEVEIDVTRRPIFTIRAYRGMTSGFLIQLIPRPAASQGANILLLVSRWSRWHTWSANVASGCFFLTLFAGCLIYSAAGLQLPDLLPGYIILGISFCAAVVTARLLRPVLAAVEHSGRNCFTDEEIASVVGEVLAAVEQSAAVAIASESE